jgi:hypothetical protein
MITQCGRCGAPQKSNYSDICEFCGGELVSSDINEIIFDEFILIKFNFLNGEFRKVINQSEEYLKKDYHNLTIWSFKIISEFLKDNLDFKDLTKSLKLLLVLKITNDISKSIIEKMIIDLLRSLNSIEVDKESDLNINGTKFSIFNLMEGWKSLHRSALLNDSHEIVEYFEFLDFSIDHFSHNYRNQLCEIYTNYFSKLNLNINNKKDFKEDFAFFNIDIHNRNQYSIITLQKIITPFDQYSKNLLEAYFDYVIRSLSCYIAFKDIISFKELFGIELTENRRSYILNLNKLKANLVSQKELIIQVINENSQEIDNFLSKQILKSEKLVDGINKKIYYKNRTDALYNYKNSGPARGNYISLFLIIIFLWVGYRFIPYSNDGKWDIYFHLIKFSLVCLGIYHLFSYLYKYISQRFIDYSDSQVDAKRNLDLLKVFIGIAFFVISIYFISNFTTSNTINIRVPDSIPKTFDITNKKWIRTYYRHDGKIITTIQPDILEFTIDSLVLRRKKLNDKKFKKGRWYYDDKRNLIIDFGGRIKSSLFDRNDTLFGINQKGTYFFCIRIN